MARKQTGFTLIEIMIVLVIIAILAAIAVPNYRDFVTRGRLTEATAGLADARSKMEQYYADNRSYPSGCKPQGTAPGATEIQVQLLQAFDLTCSLLTATTFTVTADGKASMAGFHYAIDQTGLRTSTFDGTGASYGWTAASPNNCWVIRKGGLC